MRSLVFLGYCFSLLFIGDVAAGSVSKSSTTTNAKEKSKHWLLDSFEKYQDSLESSPFYTKSITSGFIGGMGDLIAQLVQRRNNPGSFNLFRTATIALEGALVSGPMLHIMYDHFENLFPTSDSETNARLFIASAVQTLLDILVMDTILAATFMIVSGVLQGQPPKRLLYEFKNELIPTVKVSWASSALMSPLQILNFGFVPVHFRVLITNFQDMFWNAAVSWSTHRTR